MATEYQFKEVHPEEVVTLFDIETNGDKLYRGVRPDGIEQKCLDYCIAYIGEHWNGLTIGDVQIQRITGGMVNQFYRVTIPDCELMPNDVGLKIYQEQVGNSTVERSNDIILLKAISDLRIGPKVYGLSNSVAIFDFIESRYFGVEEQKNKKLLHELMRCLAIFHRMKLPMAKNRTFPQAPIKEGLDKAYEKLNCKQIAKEMGLKLMGSMCLRSEFVALSDIIVKLKAPTVLCHNDFRSQNILVSNKNSSIKLVDIEFSAYGNRPYDICGLLMEWGVGPLKLRIPDDEDIEHVCRVYIDECEQLEQGYDAKPENSLKQMIAEVKAEILRNCISIISLFAQQEGAFPEAMPYDYKQNLQLCDKIMKLYVRAKKKYIEQGVIESF